MITKPEQFPHIFFRLVIVTLLLLIPVFFALIWLRSSWPLAGGGHARLSLSQAFDCYLFWNKALCTAHLQSLGAIVPSKLYRFLIVGSLPLLALILVCMFALWYGWIRQKPRIIISGLTVDNAKGLLLAAAKEQKKSKYPKIRGLHMFLGWHLDLGRETRHFNLIGGIGSGKTIIMTRMINAAIERRDKVLIFDQKGDYTKEVSPTSHDGVEREPVLLAPQDTRSSVWNIAADLVVSQDAIELARRLIPMTENPFFAQSARAVLAGCTIKLMAEKGKRWTWSDLINETRQDQETLLRIMLRYHKGADIFLIADYKQVMSTLGQLETNMAVLNMLATAWPDYRNKKLFSMRDWLVNKTDDRTIIIQHYGRFSELSDGWISALYAVAITTVTDSTLLDDQDLRRIWFFLDEWAQLPIVENFQSFITVGRSKGICVVLGLQDAAQIASKYGPDILKTILASIGTTMIMRINHGDTAKSLEENFGQTQYIDYRYEAHTEQSRKLVDRRIVEAPFQATEFQTLLGTDRDGVKLLVSGVGNDIYKVLVPLETGQKAVREASQPAAWTYTFKPEGTFITNAEIDAYIAGKSAKHGHLPSRSSHAHKDNVSGNMPGDHGAATHGKPESGNSELERLFKDNQRPIPGR